MSDTGIGASIKRKEDKRFLTGKGNYTDDINRPRQTHAYFLRSNVAHADIKGIDISDAAKADGVRTHFRPSKTFAFEFCHGTTIRGRTTARHCRGGDGAGRFHCGSR